MANIDKIKAGGNSFKLNLYKIFFNQILVIMFFIHLMM